MDRRDRRRVRRARSGALLVALAVSAAPVAVAAPAGAAVTAIKGSACGYLTNVGLFGGPQSLKGCGQAGATPTDPSFSPSVTLPTNGSATAITATDPDGASVKAGPSTLFGGVWPSSAPSAPPSGPMSVSTQGTPAGGTVTSSADFVLRTPPNPASPGGFGPPPLEGDELHVTCTASETALTGSTRFVKGVLATSTDADGNPKATEPIPDNPPVNYTRHGVITNVGDSFTAVLNQQIMNTDGSLTVNAVHLYLFGPTAVGELVKGQATCGAKPSPPSPKDTAPPTCGPLLVEPTGPEDPTPKVPRTERIGVFDANGLQSITNVQVTNGTVDMGKTSSPPYLQLRTGQTGPLAITATRNPEAEAAGLPMTWSFDATDAAGNTVRSGQCPTEGKPAQGGTSGAPTSVARPAKEGTSVLPLVLLGAGALVAGGAVIALLTRRRRAAKDGPSPNGWQ